MTKSADDMKSLMNITVFVVFVETGTMFENSSFVERPYSLEEKISSSVNLMPVLVLNVAVNV